MRRIPVQTVAEADHDVMELEGNEWETLPDDKIYIDPGSGKTFSGQQGHRMNDLPPNAIEAPKVHCYEVS